MWGQSKLNDSVKSSIFFFFSLPKPEPHSWSICWAWRVFLFTQCAFTNAHCSHLWALQKACRALHTPLTFTYCQAVCRMQISSINDDAPHLKIPMRCTAKYFHLPQYSGSQRMHLRSLCVFMRAWFCVCASWWVINERSWIASAGYDSTTARKSFLLSPWTADSELAGIFADC